MSRTQTDAPTLEDRLREHASEIGIILHQPKWTNRTSVLREAADELARLRAENERLTTTLASGEASDGYHTHRELYEYRMLYNAHAANGWFRDGLPVVKSRRHSDGEPCFGGGWFIVVAELPTGQVSNHYQDEHWHLFDVPEVDLPPEYDGHTPADAADRLRRALTEAP
jgi:hypothetical protein